MAPRTGKVVRPGFTKLSFSPRYFFDVLRGLEHFSSVDSSWDDRLGDAVGVLLSARTKGGRWRAQNWHTGKEYFRIEGGREPSRINTLRALRVLRWVGRQRCNTCLREVSYQPDCALTTGFIRYYVATRDPLSARPRFLGADSGVNSLSSQGPSHIVCSNLGVSP